MKSISCRLKVKVKTLKNIKPGIFSLTFDSSYLAAKSNPGQFLHIKVAKTVLRRPFSIHRIKGETIHVIFRVRGRGTEIMSQYKAKNELDVIGPLGTGFNFLNSESDKSNILIAGGLGIAPLFFLASKLKKDKLIVILGAKDKEDILCEKELIKLGAKVFIATEDGSRGRKGTSLDVLKDIAKNFKDNEKINVYSCGPEAMFSEINKVINKLKANIKCEVSFEQFMGCGVGVCCGCVIATKSGYRKVCKDGPVFDIKDIW